MTHDFGFRTKAKWRGGARRALLAGLLAIAAIAALAFYASWQRHSEVAAADSKAYAVAGPPCPTTTPAQLAATGPTLKHSLDYGGMTIRRGYSEADCAWIEAWGGGYPICRFYSPGALEVRYRGADLLFAPGPGHSAAILRRKDRIACVTYARDRS